MGGLLLLAVCVFFGIIFVVYVLSSAFELAGGWGILLLIGAIILGLTIACINDKDKGK